ncbi:MAG: hypothetical protein QME81_19475 [bacterium]|nr:hypothetical protein [bacterium]
MEVKVNGRPLDVELEEENNLGEVLKGLTEWIARQGKGILHARLNGEVFPVMDKKIASMPLEDIHTLELEIVEREILPEGEEEMFAPTESLDASTIIEQLMEIKTHIPDLAGQLESVSISLTTGGQAQAMDLLQGVAKSIDEIITLLKNTRRLFDLDYQLIQIGEQNIEDKIMDLKSLLAEIIITFENNDLVMLSDLLEYELAPMLSGWEEVLTILITEVEKRVN